LTPFFYACVGASYEVANYLIYVEKIDINYTPTGFSYSPLFLATFAKDINLIRIMLNAGASIDVIEGNRFHRSSPIYQAIKSKNLEILELLLSRVNPLNVKDNNAFSPLMRSILLSKDAVHLIVQGKCDVNYQTPDGKTALMLACKSKDLDIVKLLVENGADMKMKGSNGQTPVHWAVESGRIEILDYILDNGGDPLVVDNQGQTPAHLLVSCSPSEFIPIMTLLLNSGVDINAKSHRITVFNSLIANPGVNPEIIRFLLENGASLDIKSMNGKTGYEIAQVVAKGEVKKIIEEFIKNK